MKTVRIDFNVDDTHPSIAALVGRIFGVATEPSFAEDITIDLEACEFLGPSAVATLAGLRRIAEINGRTLSIRPPRLPKLLSYCQYSGLLLDFGVGPPPESHPENATTPLHAFTGSLPLSGIQKVVTLAKSQMALSPAAQDDLTVLLTELTQNVLDHSRSPVGGLVSARAYKEVRDVRFAVADFGVGIRHTLASRFSIASDKEAIRRALQEEVTSRSSSRNLGLGLAHLHAVVRVTRGRMVIYSGDGFLRHDKGKDYFGSGKVLFPGTIAFVRLPARESIEEVSEVTDIWR